MPNEFQEVEWIGTQGQGNEYLILQEQADIQQYDTFQIGIELNSTNEQGFMGVTDVAEAYFTGNKFRVWNGFLSSQNEMAIQFLTKYDLEWYAKRVINYKGYSTLLFAYRTDRYHFNGKIYYFKWLDSNNELVQDLVPCYRKSDNEIGMYDLVSNTFYINAGTGTFIKGPDVI